MAGIESMGRYCVPYRNITTGNHAIIGVRIKQQLIVNQIVNTQNIQQTIGDHKQTIRSHTGKPTRKQVNNTQNIQQTIRSHTGKPTRRQQQRHR
jgi:hypothetical protein